MPATECSKPSMLVQRPSRIVEFIFETLDASGSVISSSSETLPPDECILHNDVRDEDPEDPNPDCDSVDAPEQ